MGIVDAAIAWLSLPGVVVMLFALALSVLLFFRATANGSTAARRRIRKKRRQARRLRRRQQRAREIMSRVRSRGEEENGNYQ